MDKYKLYHKQIDSYSIKIEQQPVYVGCSKEINCHNQLPTVPSQCGGKQTSGRSDLLINIHSALILLTPPNQSFFTGLNWNFAQIKNNFGLLFSRKKNTMYQGNPPHEEAE